MKHGIHAATALALLAGGPALALGLDRTGQDIGILFEEGGYARVDVGSVRPTITGADAAGNATGDVGQDFTTLGFGVKTDFTTQFSGALIIDQPFGVDVAYEGAPGATYLGGTATELTAQALTAIGRYRLDRNLSVHAGLRQETLTAEVTLSGLAFGEMSGYNVQLDNGTGTGWLAGVAYERPEIALRVALTYHSAIDHGFDSSERVGAMELGNSTTTVTAPEAWNLDFQTGITDDTLLFGTLRHAAYADTILIPDQYRDILGQTGSITMIEDGSAWTLGIGRRLTPAFSGQVAIGYEKVADEARLSPLSPTSGIYAITVGGAYTVDKMTVSGGLRYGRFGDAAVELGDTIVGAFSGSEVVALGMTLGYRF